MDALLRTATIAVGIVRVDLNMIVSHDEFKVLRTNGHPHLKSGNMLNTPVPQVSTDGSLLFTETRSPSST